MSSSFLITPVQNKIILSALFGETLKDIQNFDNVSDLLHPGNSDYVTSEKVLDIDLNANVDEITFLWDTYVEFLSFNLKPFRKYRITLTAKKITETILTLNIYHQYLTTLITNFELTDEYKEFTIEFTTDDNTGTGSEYILDVTPKTILGNSSVLRISKIKLELLDDVILRRYYTTEDNKILNIRNLGFGSVVIENFFKPIPVGMGRINIINNESVQKFYVFFNTTTLKKFFIRFADDDANLYINTYDELGESVKNDYTIGISVDSYFDIGQPG